MSEDLDDINHVEWTLEGMQEALRRFRDECTKRMIAPGQALGTPTQMADDLAELYAMFSVMTELFSQILGDETLISELQETDTALLKGDWRPKHDFAEEE